jgi:hypothetical protein
MRTTGGNKSMATLAPKRVTRPDDELVLALIPALGPIPPIAVTAEATPAVDLRHTLTTLLGRARKPLTPTHVS